MQRLYAFAKGQRQNFEQQMREHLYIDFLMFCITGITDGLAPRQT